MADDLQAQIHRAAETAHAFHRSNIQEGHSSVIAFASESLKAAALLNAALAAGVLAFIGQMAKDNRGLAVLLAHPLAVFGTGIVLAVAATAFSYLSQYQFQRSADEYLFDYVHPYVHETKQSSACEQLGDRFRSLAIILVVASILCAIGGVFYTAWSIATLLGEAPKV